MGLIEDDIDESTLGEEFSKPIPNAQLIYRNQQTLSQQQRISQIGENSGGDEVPFVSNGDENNGNNNSGGVVSDMYPIIPPPQLPNMYYPQPVDSIQSSPLTPNVSYQLVSPYQNVNIVFNNTSQKQPLVPLVPPEVEFYPLWTPVLNNNMNSYCIDQIPNPQEYSQYFNSQLVYIYVKPTVMHVDDIFLLQIQQCKGLQYLNLSNCQFKLDLFNKTIQGLKTLRAINLSNCTQITDDSIKILAKSCPLLEEVHLNGCRQLSDDSICFLVEKCQKIRILALSNCIKLTDRSILQICKSLKDVQSLCINKIKSLTEKSLGELKKFTGMKSFFAFNTLLTDTVMSELSIKWRSIEVLNIGKCINITDISLSTVAFHSFALQKLFLQRNRNITKLSIILVSQNCPSLRVLRVDDCYNLTDEAILTLKSCTKLEILNISGLWKISELSVLTLIPLLTELREIYMYRSPRITNATVDAISNSLPNLKVLRVDQSYFPGDQSIISLSKSCLQLHTLNVASLNITDQALISISTHLTALKKLYLNSCKSITDQGLTAICNLPTIECLRLDGGFQFSDQALKGLSRLPNLDTLNLSGLYNLTDSTVELIALQCRHIKNLYLSNCVQVTDGALPSVLLNLYKLRLLRLDGILSITLEPLSKMQFPQVLCLEVFNCSDTNSGYMGLTNLIAQSSIKELYCWSCPKITDSDLKVISEIPNLQIRVLRLDRCKGITDKGLKPLLQKLPNLHTLNISAIPKCSGDTINVIANSCKSIEKLYCHQNTAGDRAFTNLAEECRLLKIVDIGKCHNATDSTVIEFSINLHRLKRVVLSNNENITNASIIKMSVGCPLLKFVVMENCKNVGEIGVLALSTYCKQIQVLKVTNCPLVTDLSIVGIGRECLNLKTLYAGGTQISNSAIIEISVRENINFEELDLHNAKKISNESFTVLANNCISLKYLNLTGTGVSQENIQLFTDNCRLLNDFKK
ncbi:hypothetical protein DLAC_07359 [Tieghemostelium lacteum]|uniref:F-box/LRR-repeat protein 15-like leucin rich repeat domain-containing protein n=1 Tax=Tieghemostelium lacteum TaxID=361077 RepID=A0A151ZCB7_TIELA|nr:hypothetical protein DLAC_07359 [Tieghemostelium lacteum]|eukprot:KYQ91592.1 hypothetical protein DLAC_07359 [Tieghemostelium lacteum]